MNGIPIQNGALTPGTEQEIQKQVDRYTAWLAEAADHQNAKREEAAEYYERATKAVRLRGRQVRPFAPFDFDRSAIKTVTPNQALILMVLASLWGVVFFFYGIPTLVVSIGFVTIIYLGDLLLNFFLAARILTRSPEDHIDNAVVRAIRNDLWPRYTVLCPLYHEAVIVSQFVRAMSLLDYPVDKLQVLFLTEEDDQETQDAILAMDLPPHFEMVTVPPGAPRTKPRACNFGLLKATGDYIVIYDAEDIPDPLQLKKAVLAFANHPPEVACVQAKLNYYNPDQNLLTRWFTAEYSLWFDLMLPALQNARAPIPLGGTSNHFRAAVLRQVGAWDPFNVTEDCDLGLRLAHYRLQTAILDSTTYEEANSRLKNWLRQRSRWIKGYMQTYFVHTRHPLHYLREGRLRDLLWLQFTVGAKVAMLFINPLMWLLLALYIVFQSTIAPVYHILYPRPVLYLSAACLIFGNFFFLYTHLIGCLRRKQYSLMKWALLVPFYWALMSAAASIAFVQLIFKPHYWEKTQHGFHLLALARRRTNERTAAASRKVRGNSQKQTLKEKRLGDLPISPIIDTLSTWRMPAIQKAFPALELPELAEMPTTKLSAAVDMPTTRLSAVADLPTTKFAAIPRAMEHAQARRRQWRVRLPWTKDRWLGATILAAVIMSIAALWYSYSHQFILLYGDAYGHLRIARSVFDSLTPGIAEFGGVWLPLPHIIMLPLVWNDLLWRSGLAGTLPSMLCYLIAATYVFLSARRLTHNSPASFVGTLAFILNPNVLYLQTTPLTEPVLMATMTAACYYFLAWAQEDRPEHLIWAAAVMCLATLARYDGWALFLVCLVLIVPIGWLKRQRRAQIGANLLLFGILGGLGIALWVLWCAIIFKDPLYFQRGPFSAEAQQVILANKDALSTYHNIWESLRYYSMASIETLGPILFALALVALAVFILQRWRSPELLAALAFVTPFVFYVIVLYIGQVAIYVPGAAPAGAKGDLFNARFGSEIVAPAALFLATLTSRLPLVRLTLLLAILLQTSLTFQGGVITVQDGQYGVSCGTWHHINLYLVEHYNGGRVLEDIRNVEDFADAGIDVKDVIYQDSGLFWQQALKNPASMVDWVIIQPGDAVSAVINPNSLEFLEQFILVDQDKGVLLFHRKGLPLLPARSVPSNLLTKYTLCATDNPVYSPDAPAILASDTGYNHLADVWVRRIGL
ncbi:MAG TPA: glycosyltransferase [Ktedonobacterales bacterium]|jgi:cellulose synthase/poly-beta-1,6-N-acetylglucosamine synthase-like glycosyltransferase